MAAGRKGRRDSGLGASRVHTVEQGVAGAGAIEADEVDVDDLGEEASRSAVADTDGDEAALSADRILDEGCGPLRLREGGGEVVRRQNGDGAGGLLGGVVHLGHEVRAWAKVPCLKDGGVAGGFKVPCDPFRPLPVRAIVANEEVFHTCRAIAPPSVRVHCHLVHSSVSATDCRDHEELLRPQVLVGLGRLLSLHS